MSRNSRIADFRTERQESSSNSAVSGWRSDRRIHVSMVVILTLMMTFYVGAYCLTVEPVDSFEFVFRTLGFAGLPSADPNRRIPWYSARAFSRFEARRVNNALSRFFAPIHWLDRRIRPQVWMPES